MSRSCALNPLSHLFPSRYSIYLARRMQLRTVERKKKKNLFLLPRRFPRRRCAVHNPDALWDRDRVSFLAITRDHRLAGREMRDNKIP